MNSSYKSYEENQRIDKSIRFLVEKVKEHCHNKKPLLSHCFRVAFRLDSLGYKTEIVQAALLHDLLEDTNTSIGEIEKNFGKKVATLVKLMTFNVATKDRIEQYRENFINMKNNKSSLVIRAADLIENSYYYDKAPDLISYRYLLDKYSYFLSVSKIKIQKEIIYKDLIYRFNILKKNENNLYK